MSSLLIALAFFAGWLLILAVGWLIELRMEGRRHDR